MGFLLAFLIVVVIFMYLPRILMWLAAYLVRRRAQKMFGQFTDPSRAARGQSGKKEPEPAPAPAKKIDPTVGEYVRFEEIEVEAQTTETLHADGTTERTTQVRVEEQVVDVEWEDIP